MWRPLRDLDHGAMSKPINAASLEPVALNVQGGEAPEWIELIPALIAASTAI